MLGDVEDGDDVGRAGEARGGERLALEACAERLVGRVARGEDLQCHLTPELTIGRTEDLAHAAASDRTGVAVTGRKGVGDGRHA